MVESKSNIPKNNLKKERCGSLVGLGAMLLVGILMAMPADSPAFMLYRNSQLEVNLDSTLSWGMLYRQEKRDEGIIGIANGGKAYSVNYDDGNLNYDRGVVSNAVKLTSELNVRADDYGAFFRGTAFYDYENMERDRARTPLSDHAEDAVGANVDLLDAYVWRNVDLGSIPLQVRVGEQVVSWGESTFIPGSINSINSIDVSKIRIPGAELKEALVPEGMIWASMDVTPNTCLEALYLYDWEETKVDEPGTYFSAGDFVGDGGYKLLLGYGKVPDQGDKPVADTFLAASRDPDKQADNQGQFGMAIRTLVPALNDSELGFYYLRYHSRLPVLSVRTGTATGLSNAAAGAGAVYAQAGVAPGTVASVDAAAQAVALDAYIKSGGYYTEYVEDIDLYGLSFSTELFGLGWQGEISYRPDAPIQIDDAELLLHILGPLNPAMGSLSQLGPATELNQQIPGYIERDMTQVQTTVTKILNPGFLGHDSGVILGEIGWVHVSGMPDKDKLRMEGAGTFTPGNPVAAAASNVPVAEARHFADADSWGYRLLAKLDYYNAIGTVNLSPRIAWAHDVSGNSPFGGPFLEDRQALTLGLTAEYLSWSADLSYTRFMGNEDHNLIHDRDFIGLSIKYAF
jgi:hypothetical protein